MRAWLDQMPEVFIALILQLHKICQVVEGMQALPTANVLDDVGTQFQTDYACHPQHLVTTSENIKHLF